MKDSTSELVDILAGLAIMLLALTLTISLFQMGNRYDEAVMDAPLNKESVTYTFAYLDFENTLSREEVITDILENSGYVKLNGNTLPSAKVSAAREYSVTGIAYLKNTISQDEYHITYEYDTEGELIGLSFDE